ncbi:type 1 glutamine amidotransferase [Phaeobacter marinintestinus]|uniref:type 1 glutamine amidotransferase n=1 Tax=Falsiphaeobacter marinintestinus TaxID=1492905 RepID=UPI0011B39FE3|nr:type 1 glutamine amidotransferase [Phaeobacter marinintestinus]
MARIAIIDVAALPAPHLDGFGSVADMVTTWLGPHLPEADLIGVDVVGGAALPTVNAFDGFILPGSEAGVYDERDWMDPLRDLLLHIRTAGKPVYGICFGHQMMAHSYGGAARKEDKGFCLGARDFTSDQGDTITGHVSHQDQVVTVPPGATVQASADYCPVAALSYDFPAMSTQFHPEYPPDFIRAIADLLENDLMTPDQVQAARQSLSARPVAQDLFAEKVAGFFRAHL